MKAWIILKCTVKCYRSAWIIINISQITLECLYKIKVQPKLWRYEVVDNIKMYPKVLDDVVDNIKMYPKLL